MTDSQLFSDSTWAGEALDAWARGRNSRNPDRLRALGEVLAARVRELEARSPHRTTDPQTSRDGARSFVMRAGSQRARLLAAYADWDVVGLTDAEAAEHAGLRDQVGCCWWKRCSELRQAGYIADTEMTRTDPHTMEERMVCLVTDKGKAAAAKLNQP